MHRESEMFGMLKIIYEYVPYTNLLQYEGKPSQISLRKNILMMKIKGKIINLFKVHIFLTMLKQKCATVEFDKNIHPVSNCFTFIPRIINPDILTRFIFVF